ncbi:hypothetical protein PC120_g15634 [Phytophthora cactorum]|nr:hypothetical protein PC120_g15634 [Phytophthora cactorum]
MVPYHYPVELLKRAATDLEAQLEYEGEVEREVHAAEAGEAPQAQAAAVQAVTTTKVRGRDVTKPATTSWNMSCNPAERDSSDASLPTAPAAGCQSTTGYDPEAGVGRQSEGVVQLGPHAELEVGQPNCSHGRKDRCRTVNSRHPNEQLRDFCDASVAGATVAAGWMDETAMSVQGQLLGGPAGAEAGEIECSVENFTNGAQVGASQAENENESARHTISTTRGTKLLRTDVRVRASNENENGVRS